jgi:hypothetical protein
MKIVLLLLFAFPAWVFAQNTADSLAQNSQITIKMLSDTGVVKADTLSENQYYSKEKTLSTRIDSLPEIKMKKNLILFILAIYTNVFYYGANANEYKVGDKTYLAVKKLAPYMLATNDEETIRYYGRHRFKRPIYMGLFAAGGVVSLVGFGNSSSNFRTGQRLAVQEYIYAGLGMMAASVVIRINAFRNLRKSVNKYNSLRSISYNLKPSSSSLGLSFSVGF